MVDLHSQYMRIQQEVNEAIQGVLTSTAFIQGPQVSEFASALSHYSGAEHVITCGNGTDALQIAMMALELKPGDEVIVPVHTYVATAEVIALLGLTPLFVDVNKDTFTIDIDQLKTKLTNRTKAIVPVHLYGQCVAMEALMQIASENGLYVIEDAAQAIGARYQFEDGTIKQAGTMGTIGTTSFFPSKNLGCFGDGGAIFTQDEKLADKMRMIANHGQKIKYHHDTIGINSRLDTLQAAILNVKLKYLDEYTLLRNKVAEYYDLELAGIDSINTPVRNPASSHVFHQYTIKVSDGKRDRLRMFLADRGIPTMIYYPVPLHLQRAYARVEYPEGTFPVTEYLSSAVLSLPIHTEMDEQQLSYICSAIKDFATYE
jgi:UDP-2-acetamido-2-deoxy-ribo-hexuluronate aminotransferase